VKEENHILWIHDVFEDCAEEWDHAMISATSQQRNQITCLSCGASIFRTMPTRDRMHAIEGRFRLLQCVACDLAFMQPQPTDAVLAAHYPDTYYAYIDGEVKSGPGPQLQRYPLSLLQRWTVQVPIRLWNRAFHLARNKVAPDRRLRATLSRTTDSGRCLDIGCGNGKLLDALRAQGCDTFGIDISQKACDAARRKGHHTFCGEVTEARFPETSFDLITMMHSIEHVRNPLSTMTAVQRLLSPHGQVIIATPNAGSWLFNVFRRWYWQVDSPRHLHLFSPQAMRHLAQQTDLTVQDLYTGSDWWGVTVTALYFLSDLLVWPHDRFLLGRDGSRVYWPMYKSYLRPVLDIFCLIADLCAKGDNLYVHLIHRDN